MKGDKDSKRLEVKDYKAMITARVNQEVKLVVNPNGHSERMVDGIISYASSALFGVKVVAEAGEYTLSFSYIDVYTGKVKLLD